jgi:hypothetical protein
VPRDPENVKVGTGGVIVLLLFTVLGVQAGYGTVLGVQAGYGMVLGVQAGYGTVLDLHPVQLP